MINSFTHPRLGYCSLRRGPSPCYLVRSPNGHCYMPVADDKDLIKYLSTLLDPCAVQVLYVNSCRYVAPYSAYSDKCASADSTRVRVRVCGAV